MAITLARRQHREQEGESVFVSMTDLTVSFLFIILVLLAFFASQFKPEKTVTRAIYDELLAENERLRASQITLRQELNASQEHAQSLAHQIERLHQLIAELQLEIAWLLARNAELDKLNPEIERLHQLIAELQLEIARLLARNAELDKPDPVATYLEEIAKTRVRLLEQIAAQLRQKLPGIRITVVATDGVIRFRGDELFRPGQWRIEEGSTTSRAAHAIGDALADTLPCYTVGGSGAALDRDCNAAFAAIETIQIEGHTDNIPLSEGLRAREQMRDNLDLSARRGAETLRAMTDRYRPALMGFLNLRGQPVLSFAGYGALRPIEHSDLPEARATNRRIDLRFILQTPQNVPEVEAIRAQLIQHRLHLPPISATQAP